MATEGYRWRRRQALRSGAEALLNGLLALGLLYVGVRAAEAAGVPTGPLLWLLLALAFVLLASAFVVAAVAALVRFRLYL